MKLRANPAKTTLAASILASLAAAQPAVAREAWVSTATVAIPVASLAGATDLGSLPATQALTVRVGLTMQNRAALLSLVTAAANPASPSFGQYLSPRQFARGYAPSPAQVNSVVRHLSQAGFTNIVVEPNNLLISADGTAAMAETAFHTSLEQVSIDGVTGYTNIAPAQVPANLGSVVTAVLGLNSVGKMASTLTLPNPPQYLVSYNPTQFQTIYSVGSTPPASKASIAIMAEGDLTAVVTDLRTEEAAFGLPQVPLTIVPVGVPSSDTSGADEWDLDTQYSSGIAGTLKMLYVYDTTSLSDSDLALEFSRWATDDKAKAASASLGECEVFPFADGSMAIDDMIFLEAASQGQTFFASAGDTGPFCPAGPAGVNGVPAGAPFVSYPASSPYVVGVGGTTLLTNADGSYNSEVTWYAGGGGLSQFEAVPGWQAPALGPIAKTSDRGVPDVAMDADPESGANVYVNGTSEGVGGTSLSSPLALGVWARAVSQNRKLGFASPILYGLYDPTGGTGGVTGTYPKGGFHDITAGTNGIYPALPGYDLSTGLGTFIIDQFVADLRK